MNRNKPSHSVISTGTTSIVLIFVLLCMLTFAVLSLVSAQADLRLSRLSAQRTTDYYAAESAANEILIRIEDAAARAASELAAAEAETEEETARPADFSTEVFRLLDADDGVTRTREGRLVYEVPLGNNQALYVELSVSPELTGRGRHYTIHAWQAVSAYEWEPDESLNVAQPDSFPFLP